MTHEVRVLGLGARVLNIVIPDLVGDPLNRSKRILAFARMTFLAPRASSLFSTFLAMKNSATIWHILAILVVSAGLLYLTQSWWMSLGILMLILLADAYIAMYQQRRDKDKEEEE